MQRWLYSLSDLASLAGVTPRTVRYYIREGLLRPPGTRGSGARYEEGHLWRLQLIKQLQRHHLPLTEIRKRLAAMTDPEVRDLAAAPPEPAAGTALEYVRSLLRSKGTSPSVLATASAPIPDPLATPIPAPTPMPTPSGTVTRDDTFVTGEAVLQSPQLAGPGPVPLERSSWERIVLSPDIELHVRRPLSRLQNRFLSRLLDKARQLLEEDV